ncbi:RidA family protein [Cyclobacterium marinum]|uniref:Endoribonuclease L-PSP n=1 Tax=Cyclobacterium marinum (strain ATCC 25205 / DSM 745 / LMG 13164 / NCIMB 1802) TaxID=880070 RepID=G0IVP8_CYCMS|nr:RidA family protein [Cyclobacterium marinum]AEL24815.1 endoribonuclease L-PSP [Cyclobacterium marinum DSM 745]MBI0401712.1 RidA family protein [Cyclobacterium marinum]MBR9774728.1 RidA family protein [Cytophagales bacterium]|tara:strand:+ start:15123 stop:15503 length:381 start_codon:yes stop_codon:yes gene_type:complete
MSKEIINSPDAPAPIGPYSQAVKANGMLFVSGQIALDADSGELLNANITEETHAVMKNLDAILSASGLTFSNVVKCSIFVKNMADFSTINEAYGQYFKTNPPARETVEVSRLPKDVQVEISCIAVL